MKEEELTQAFKALGHPKRLRIVQRLLDRVYSCCQVNREEDCCLEEPTCDFGALKEELAISKSSLSLHLKELRRAGLVESIKKGRQIAVQVNPDRLEELKTFFELSIDRHTRQWMEKSR